MLIPSWLRYRHESSDEEEEDEEEEQQQSSDDEVGDVTDKRAS